MTANAGVVSGRGALGGGDGGCQPGHECVQAELELVFAGDAYELVVDVAEVRKAARWEAGELAAEAGRVFLYRQFRVRPPADWRRATVLPLALIGWGVVNTAPLSSLSVVAVAISATGVGLGIILGVTRGYATDIWLDHHGMVLQKGTAALAILWVLSIAVRIGLSVIGGMLGTSQTEAYAEIPLFFGVTLAAQNATIWAGSETTARQPQADRWHPDQ